MNRYIIPLPLLAALALTGCYYDNEEDLYPDCGVLDATWSTGIRPLVQSRCAIYGCHVGGTDSAPGNFNNIEDLQTRINQIRGNVIDPGGVMPPAGYTQLSQCEKQQLAVWLDAGAPNN